MTTSAYLDHNATSPLAPEVRDAMLPWLEGIPANPSSVHCFGQRARAAVEAARAQVAALCGGGDVVFTSGGTEADNLVVHGLLGRGGHAVVSAIEHPAILEPLAALRAQGVEVSPVPVDSEGRALEDDVIAALRDDTGLVSIMAANNETGTVQAVAAVAAAATDRGIPMHCDAVQAAAWLDLPGLLGTTTLVSLSGHKIGGPPGVGALVVRTPCDLDPQLHGGGQQQGRRPGSEPTALLVGFGAACERARTRRAVEADRIALLTERLQQRILGCLDGVRITVPEAARLPNTLHLCVNGCRADVLVARLDLEGVCVSAGSACASGVSHGSYVLAALGIPTEFRDGAIRMSLGYNTRNDEIDFAVDRLAGAVAALRESHASVGGAR